MIAPMAAAFAVGLVVGAFAGVAFLSYLQARTAPKPAPEPAPRRPAGYALCKHCGNAPAFSRHTCSHRAVAP